MTTPTRIAIALTLFFLALALISFIPGAVNFWTPVTGGLEISLFHQIGYQFGGEDPGWYRPISAPWSY
jgi:hypothetical protein